VIDVDLASLGGRIGEEVAVSDWLEITQQRIDCGTSACARCSCS